MAVTKQYTKKDGNKAWLFQAYLGTDPLTGKEKRTTRRGFKTEKEAKLALSRLQLDIDKNGFRSDYKVNTYKELFELWFEQHSNNIKPTTQQRIRIMFDKNILPRMGHIKLQKITPAMCQKVINDLSKKYASYIKIKSYISKVFKFGILINVISDNPMERVITPKRIEKDEKEELELFYTKEELRQFFDCLKQLKDNLALTFFRVLAFTGARKGEVMALTWNDVDLDNGTITLNKTLVELADGTEIVQDPKTKTSIRNVSIDQETITTLRKWKSFQNERTLALGKRAAEENNLVFPCHNGNPKKEYLYQMYPNVIIDMICRKFPEVKRIKTHGFRHTHASLLFESGENVKAVQQRLGHSSIQTTMDIYTHVTPKREKDTGLRFAKYVNF